MTADRKPTYVVDSCCVISLLIDEDPGRTLQLTKLFEDAEQGNCTLILPTVARLEILGIAPQRASSGHPTRRRKAFQKALEWLDSRPFLVSELDEFTVRAANSLILDHGLRGIDAAIIATGLVWEASKVLTYDEPMLDASSAITELSIEKPSNSLWENDLFNQVDDYPA